MYSIQIALFICLLHISSISSGYFARDTELGGFGSPCNYDDECLTVFSFCRLHKRCECRKGYSYNAQSDACLAEELNLPCEGDFDCKNIKNARCKDNVCQCFENHGNLTKKECIPASRLTASCQNDETCKVSDVNSSCNRDTGRCDCKKNYHPSWDTQQCVLNKRLKESCISHGECAVTSDQQDLIECRTDGRISKCACKPGVKEVDNTCKRDLGGEAASTIANTLFLTLTLIGLIVLN